MKKKMSEPNRIYMQERINDEGFEYTFLRYSDFDEIRDSTFHAYRNAYLKARKDLIDYMGIQ